MPYYIGDVIKDSQKLTARTPEQFREAGIDVRINTRVEAIDSDKRQVRLADGTQISYDILTLATGMTALTPGIAGEDLAGVFLLKSLQDALRIKQYLEEMPCRKAIIVGAGFIGLEMCENLKARGLDVQMVHRDSLPANRWDPDLAREILAAIRREGIDFIAETTLLSIERGSSCRLRLNTNHGPLEGDLILLAVGVKPNTALARAMGLALGDTNAIRVNLSQRTSREDVYAVGDCAESYHRVSKRWVNIPLGDIANKQGRTAGSTIGGVPRIFPGIVGAQSFRVFHLEVAATGIDEREARASGYDPVSVIAWGNASARALPDAKPIALKLIADRSTGCLLGAQGVGEAGVVGRINTLSVALWSGLILDEIAYLDLAYAPPFSGSWDLIHTAAQALLRKL